MDECEKLHAVLADLPLGYDDAAKQITRFEGIERCIVEGLRRSVSNADWSMFDRYTFAASCYPDRSMTAVLCEVLDRQLDEVSNDDIVLALDDIADPASIGSLERAMWWEPSWDEFRQLAFKCVLVLSRIGTPEAVAVLRDAASTGPERIREIAATELQRLGDE